MNKDRGLEAGMKRNDDADAAKTAVLGADGDYESPSIYIGKSTHF